MRRSPSNSDGDQNLITRLPADTLLVWDREVVGTVVGGRGYLRYLKTPDGYIYGGMIQPVGNQPNIPIEEIPSGKDGFWVEVTVPYVDLAHDGVQTSPWLRDLITYNFLPRLYHGQVMWMDQIHTGNGLIEYRWNEDANGRGYGYGGYGEFYWADGAGLRVLTEADVAPFSPDVDPAEKTMQLNLDRHVMACYEGTREVYCCRVSTGIVYTNPATGELVDYSTALVHPFMHGVYTAFLTHLELHFSLPAVLRHLVVHLQNQLPVAAAHSTTFNLHHVSHSPSFSSETVYPANWL